MKRFNLFKNRRGAANIIGSLLILLIVTMLCVTAYSWAASTVNSSQNTFNSVLGNRQDAIAERFILEYVFFSDTDGNPGDHKNVTIYVRNVGETDITISAVYLNGTLSSTISPVLPQTLLSDQATRLSITLVDSWNLDSTAHIVVASEKGNRIQGYWQAS